MDLITSYGDSEDDEPMDFEEEKVVLEISKKNPEVIMEKEKEKQKPNGIKKETNKNTGECDETESDSDVETNEEYDFLDPKYLEKYSLSIRLVNDNWNEDSIYQNLDIPYKPLIYSTEEQHKSAGNQIPCLSDRVPFGHRRELSVKNILPTTKVKYSKLTREMHADYMNINKRPADPAKVQYILKLGVAVAEEQKEYKAFCQKLAPYINYEIMPLRARHYIERNLKERQKMIPYNYAKLYTKCTNISLIPSLTQCYLMKNESCLLSIGTVGKFVPEPLGDTVKDLWLPVACVELLEKRYPSDDSISSEFIDDSLKDKEFMNHTPVSKDLNIQKFIQLHDVDIVISSSSLKHLIDNQQCLSGKSLKFPEYLPAIVESYTDTNNLQHKVVIIDKALPRINMTAYEKKLWLCKRAARLLFSHQHKEVLNKEDPYNRTKIMESSTYDEDMKHFQENHEQYSGAADNYQVENLDFYAQLRSLFPEELKELDISLDDDTEDMNDLQFERIPAPGNNYSYCLWKLTIVDKSTNKKGSSLKILVRHHNHCYIETDDVPKDCYISVKLEHQPEYGCQLLSLSEIAYDWMSIKLRPKSQLFRVRVDANSLKIIQTQTLNLKELEHEANRLGFDTNKATNLMYHIFDNLTRLSVGNYLLQLEPREEHINVLQEEKRPTNLRGGSYYSLHLDYKRHSRAQSGPTSCVPYTAIDSQLQTPTQREQNIIPCTFPSKSVQAKQDSEKVLNTLMEKLVKKEQKATEKQVKKQKKKDKKSTKPSTSKDE